MDEAAPRDLSPTDWELVARHLTGDLAPDAADPDGRRLAQLLRARPELVQASDTLWSALDPADLGADAPNELEALSRLQRREKPRVQAQGVRPTPVRSWLLGAGFICAAAMVVVFATRASLRPGARDSQEISYSTGVSQRNTVRLPDGSRAVLAPMTTVRYSKGVVRIDGEVYFDVAQSALPFSVMARGTIVSVLGTAFSVRSYAGAPAVRVVVASGRVSVMREGEGRKAMVLAARNAAQVEPNVIRLERDVDPSAELAWAEGKLVYKGAPLASVLEDMRRWYGADAQLADPALGKLPITVALDENADVRSTIELMAAAVGAHVSWSNGRATIAR